MSRYASPTLDLFYNIFSSTDKALRDPHYDDLLKLYHSTLSGTIKKMGSDPEKLFSWTDFMSQLKKFGKFAFTVSAIINEIRLAGSDKVSNLDEFSKSENNDDESAGLVSKLSDDAERKFSELMTDAVRHLVELGYL